MKSEHRHDLKTNELADWVSRLPQWLDKNRNNIIYFFVAVVLIIAGWMWYSSWKSAKINRQMEFADTLSQVPQQRTQAFISYMQGQSVPIGLSNLADKLSTISDEMENKNAAALALIERAETIRAELHFQKKSPDINQLTTQINKAKDSYQKALGLLDEQALQGYVIPALIASARYGLGLCAEDLGNFDEAERIYKELVSTESLKDTPAGAQAQVRLNIMNGYEQPITFKPMPLIITEPQLVSPGTSPNDVNLVPPTTSMIESFTGTPVEVIPSDMNFIDTFGGSTGLFEDINQ